MSRRVCLGAFAGAHGVKGDALVKTFTGKTENIAAYGPVETEEGSQRFTLAFLRETKPGLAVVRAPEIKTREAAMALKGVRLFVDRAQLPPPEDDDYYFDDLVGLAAEDEIGAPAGRVSAVYDFGAGDLLELAEIPDVKGVRLISFTKTAVPVVDIKAGRIVVARAALSEVDGSESGEPRTSETPALSDDTGEVVSVDADVALDAMRQEDA